MANANNDRDNKIVELEGLAKGVLEVKENSIPRRPIVIEFCGSPKSGKSSCINSLDLFLRRNNFRTKVLTERASICPVKRKYDPNFNIWTVCSAIAELAEVLSNHSKSYDVVLLDRGIFDALCWFNWLKRRNSLDNEEFEGLENFLLMNKWQSIIDLVYVFTATPDESMKREYANLLTKKTGSIMRPDILNTYRESVIESSKQYENSFQKIEYFDTTNLDIDTVNYSVTKNTLEILRENLVEKIGYVDRSIINSHLPETFNLKDTKLASINMSYGFRDEIESNDEYVQPIPILVITNKERNKIFVVKKRKNSVSNDSPEKNKLLVYLGGHSRKEDSFGKRDLSLFNITKQSLKREIKEETGLDYIPPESDSNPSCIWLRDHIKSKKHLAILYIWEVDFSITGIKLDSNEFMVSGNTISGSVMSLSEITKREKELENWSKVILRDHFKLNLFPSLSIFDS